MTAKPRQFTGCPEMVREARRFVSRALVDAGVPHEVIEGAVLAASELATNAVMHSYSGAEGGTFDVCVEITPDAVRVEVADAGSDESTPVRRGAGPDAEGGRGLLIASAIGEPYDRRDPDGRRVGVLIARPDAPAAVEAAVRAPSAEEVG